MKSKRHAIIRDIIETQAVETQEELAEALRSRDIQVTQATVSRDIKEMMLFKVPTESGRYRYAAPQQENLTFTKNRLARLLKDNVTGVDSSENLGLVVDGADVKWDRKKPFIYPDARKFKVRDFGQGCAIELEFETSTPVFIGPIFSASTAAAPQMFQGIRIYPFWKSALDVSDRLECKMSITLSKR